MPAKASVYIRIVAFIRLVDIVRADRDPRRGYLRLLLALSCCAVL